MPKAKTIENELIRRERIKKNNAKYWLGKKRPDMSKIIKGRKTTEKTKERLSLALRGRKLSEETCKKMMGRIPWNKGKPCSQEVKDKLRKSMIGRKLTIEHRKKCGQHNIGKHYTLERRKKISDGHKKIVNWNYNGGITLLVRQIRQCFEYRQWRSDIFKRDNYICQKCEENRRDLEAHHIKKFNDIIGRYNIKTTQEALMCSELWDINNGITYCKTCHKKIEKKRK